MLKTEKWKIWSSTKFILEYHKEFITFSWFLGMLTITCVNPSCFRRTKSKSINFRFKPSPVAGMRRVWSDKSTPFSLYKSKVINLFAARVCLIWLTRNGYFCAKRMRRSRKPSVWCPNLKPWPSIDLDEDYRPMVSSNKCWLFPIHPQNLLSTAWR